MTRPTPIQFEEARTDDLAQLAGRVAIFASEDGRIGPDGRKLNSLTRKAVERMIDSDRFERMKAGEVVEIAVPGGMQAGAVLIVKLPRRASVEDGRKAGAALAAARGKGALHVLCAGVRAPEEVALGLVLKSYTFTKRKSAPDAGPDGAVTFRVKDVEEAQAAFAPLSAIAEGVYFTRDLVNEPANVLTTTEFAKQLKGLESLGLTVEVLEEDQLEKMGMGSLLCVGQGSASPSKVVVMQWKGGKKDDAPFAFVGKGVVFDTGGISLKPAAGMEDMTMDMGGAGVVAGVMKTLALRKAKANVVGLVGLVENMPSGTATRPGDVVTSMKGDTIEVINTDAEGRLVLADVLWYAQERFKPRGMINLATLTGAMVIALGHENAGVFSNNDDLAGDLIKAAGTEGEGAWRLPMGPAYDKLIDSNIADIKNTGGRPAGSITAAQFLRRFVKDETPWCHIDIAGVASLKSASTLAPKGATGWGVMTLNRLIADTCEG
ncbi:leucyl aminopeptidase [Loktanella sp. IMCC34160]|uniref:leucyl aminopeptidase n=1 Tax=Loktanella sp. IMCC34160 TaxID=2510646 RepID=UPI00101C5914|nr:leucyl aminopeptidase [Loktanella sp. IMCC34160]RYG91856.1 leucyl aminopeptidase [Loktanella sp. IMCC34160]